MTIRIGITGPIGCGKSTVAGWLGELGAMVIDADAVARAVIDDDGPTLAAILDAFGPAVQTDDGLLDRSALAKIVFADPAALARLEALVHPAVRRSILASIAAAENAANDAIVIEAIKLVEGGLANACDEVWLVTCEPDLQLVRLAARGMARDDAVARITAQGRIRQVVEPVATRLIDTSGTLEDARTSVEAALAAALMRAAALVRAAVLVRGQDDEPKTREEA